MRLTRRGRFVVGALAVLTLWVWIVGSFALGQAWKDDRVSRESGQITCQEDMPCWDCSTDGNGRCGP